MAFVSSSDAIATGLSRRVSPFRRGGRNLGWLGDPGLTALCHGLPDCLTLASMANSSVGSVLHFWGRRSPDGHRFRWNDVGGGRRCIMPRLLTSRLSLLPLSPSFLGSCGMVKLNQRQHSCRVQGQGGANYCNDIASQRFWSSWRRPLFLGA